jgi:hypothetical protein
VARDPGDAPADELRPGGADHARDPRWAALDQLVVDADAAE